MILHLSQIIRVVCKVNQIKSWIQFQIQSLCGLAKRYLSIYVDQQNLVYVHEECIGLLKKIKLQFYVLGKTNLALAIHHLGQQAHSGTMFQILKISQSLTRGKWKAHVFHPTFKACSNTRQASQLNRTISKRMIKPTILPIFEGLYK